ncbi:MAG TPA: hypothetical protein VJR89_03815 [Polyangiales bacterium]|nr:hypothetical protein [Polyangiales bacterium]
MLRTRLEDLRRLASVSLCVFACFDCAHASSVEPDPPRPAPVAAKPKPDAKRLLLEPPESPRYASLGDVMGDHFMITSWARNSVIAGVIDPLRLPLAALAAYHYDDVAPGGWVAWIAQLQESARLTSEAATLEVAAMGVATMARVCGECHRANHAGPALPPVGSDPLERVAADDLNERMARHMWASELLWEGLTGPSDAVWSAGAKALLSAPDELAPRLTPGFDAQLQAIKRLGESAAAVETLADRANLYGLLLATCADCHARWLTRGAD